MKDVAPTLEATVHVDAAKPPGEAPHRGGLKFTYASGTKPLDGFTLKRGVGIGGFGEVYFAVSDAGKEVALKRVQRNLEVELRGVSQCLNLKHPNLVDLYDIRYDDQGNAWVVMEYVAGESLKDVLDRNPNGLPPDQVLHWFTGIAEGVKYLHDNGIVHRDLKPGNIFNDQGYIKIGDYGLSKFISASRRSGQTESVGTFHYMAPEIGKGVYGKEIDIYALGVILNEMLTGKVPFDGESSQEIIMRHLTEDADVSALPQPYQNIVANALVKDPELRSRDVNEMLAALSGSTTSAKAFDVVPASIVPPNDVYYISDEPPPREMVFGPVKQRRGTRQPAVRQVQPVAARPATPVRAAGPTREPIAQAISNSARKVSNWWQDSKLSTGLKVIIVLLLAVGVILGSPWFIPLGAAAGILYATYLGIWMVMQAANASTSDTPSGIRFRSWQELTREQMRAKPVGIRLGELSGSFLTAALINVLLGIVMVAVGDKFGGNVDTVGFYTWLTVSATLGSWAVLGVGKFCEGVEGEAVRRRVVMLALGLGVGSAIFYMDGWLGVPLTISEATSSPFEMTSFVTADGLPQLPLFLLYLGALFVVPGWWKQTDPMRKTRVNLLAVGAAVLWAWLLSLALPFPQPWGYMLAAMMALTAQLASPWFTAKQREAARREFRRA